MPTPAHLAPLVVFADDWGRHPSSAQHLVRHLLPTRPVVWVNTIGTRPPRLDRQTLRRAAGKLRGWTRHGHDAGVAAATLLPVVLNPKMWPSFASTITRRLNRALLARCLTPVLEALPAPPVVVTTLPLVADLVGLLPAARWVYYCVDDFSVWPGYDGATMLRMERDLVAKVDRAVAVSDTLVEHLGKLGRSAELLTHGVDLPHWQTPLAANPPPELAGIPPPWVLFWGVVDRRLDLDFIRHLSAHPAAGSVVLIGPPEAPDPALFDLPRVFVRPAVAYARLPGLAQAAAVLVMPYADAPVTRAMQPLKMKEYLATGRPCVVRDLPSTLPWADCLDVAASPAEFTAYVVERLTSGVPAGQAAARGRLAQEGWAAKAAAFARVLDD